MLTDYMHKLSRKSKFEEANNFKVYIQNYKENKPMNDFFSKYQIGIRRKYIESSNDEIDDDEASDSLFGKVEKIYYIKRRLE